MSLIAILLLIIFSAGLGFVLGFDVGFDSMKEICERWHGNHTETTETQES